MLTWIMCMIWLYGGNAYDIYYQQENEAVSSVIDCNEDEICNIYINGNGAIQSSTIHCPSQQHCNIYCNADLSCFKTIINCPSVPNVL